MAGWHALVAYEGYLSAKTSQDLETSQRVERSETQELIQRGNPGLSGALDSLNPL